MIDVAAGGWLRFLARAGGHGLFRFAFHSVRIGKNETAFVFGAGIEIEKAARKHVGCDIAVVMPAAVAWQPAEHLLVLQAEKREALAPLLLALLAISDVDARVAIVVARDFPREAERDQSGRIDDELAGNGVVLTPAEPLGKTPPAVSGRITTNVSTVIYFIDAIDTAGWRARLTSGRR